VLSFLEQKIKLPSRRILLHLWSKGEQRYWVHVAIDRFTGQVIDRHIEVVKE